MNAIDKYEKTVMATGYCRVMDDSQSKTGERLRERMDEIGVDQAILAKAIGISQGAISFILTGKTVNSRHLPRIAENLAINLAWLRGTSDVKIDMHGDDGAAMSELDALRLEKHLRSPSSSYIAEISDYLGHVMIPQLDIGYSMGGGSVFADFQQRALVPFPRDWLRPLIKGRFEDIFVARGEGDSMQPTLLDGDVIIVDTAQKDVRQQDRLWCLSYGDLGMIKRVRRLPDGGYQINSDNPAVSPITAYDGEMHVVGRVVWIGRKV